MSAQQGSEPEECRYCGKKCIYWSKEPFTDSGKPTRAKSGKAIPLDWFTREAHLCKENPFYEYLMRQEEKVAGAQDRFAQVRARLNSNQEMLSLLQAQNGTLQDVAGLAMEMQTRVVEELAGIHESVNIIKDELTRRLVETLPPYTDQLSRFLAEFLVLHSTEELARFRNMLAENDKTYTELSPTLRRVINDIMDARKRSRTVVT